MTYVNSRTRWDVSRQDFSLKRNFSIPKAITVAVLGTALAYAAHIGVTSFQQLSAGLTIKLQAVPAAATSLADSADALRTRADAVRASAVPITLAGIPEGQRAELLAGGASRVVPCYVIGGPDLAAAAEVLDTVCGVR